MNKNIPQYWAEPFKRDCVDLVKRELNIDIPIESISIFNNITRNLVAEAMGKQMERDLSNVQ